MRGMAGLKQELLSYMESLPIFDGHEHFLSPTDRADEETGFFEMLQYILSDLISSGLEMDLLDKNISLDERIEAFLKAYDNSKNTSYCKLIPILAKD